MTPDPKLPLFTRSPHPPWPWLCFYRCLPAEGKPPCRTFSPHGQTACRMVVFSLVRHILPVRPSDFAISRMRKHREIQLIPKGPAKRPIRQGTLLPCRRPRSHPVYALPFSRQLDQRSAPFRLLQLLQHRPKKKTVEPANQGKSNQQPDNHAVQKKRQNKKKQRRRKNVQ